MLILSKMNYFTVWTLIYGRYTVFSMKQPWEFNCYILHENCWILTLFNTFNLYLAILVCLQWFVIVHFILGICCWPLLDPLCIDVTIAFFWFAIVIICLVWFTGSWETTWTLLSGCFHWAFPLSLLNLPCLNCLSLLLATGCLNLEWSIRLTSVLHYEQWFPLLFDMTKQEEKVFFSYFLGINYLEETTTSQRACQCLPFEIPKLDLFAL